MDKNRNLFLDIVKGIAIFLMLWGHCIQYCVAGSEIDFFENNMFKFIYSFHMPLFMLVSGYLFFYSFSKRDLNNLLIHRTQSLLQPIVFCSVFSYAVTTALFKITSGDFGSIFGENVFNCLTSLWFLWSVLASSIAVAIICKKVRNLFLQILLLFLAVPIVAIFPCGTLNLYMYPYFVLGFYFAQHKDTIPQKILFTKYISIPLFPILLFFFEKKHYIYTTGLLPNNNYSAAQMLFIDAYRWLIGLVGSVFVITILEFVYNLVIVKLKRPFISSALAKMGKKSLQIYAFSVPFLSIYLSKFFPKMLSVLSIDNVFANNELIYNFFFTFSLAVVYSFALYYFVKGLEKTKITKIMFGR